MQPICNSEWGIWEEIQADWRVRTIADLSCYIKNSSKLLSNLSKQSISTGQNPITSHHFPSYKGSCTSWLTISIHVQTCTHACSKGKPLMASVWLLPPLLKQSTLKSQSPIPVLLATGSLPASVALMGSLPDHRQASALSAWRMRSSWCLTCNPHL
jgi:hypothetical protein